MTGSFYISWAIFINPKMALEAVTDKHHGTEQSLISILGKSFVLPAAQYPITAITFQDQQYCAKK